MRGMFDDAPGLIFVAAMLLIAVGVFLGWLL